ncbi:MAG: transcription elongation factor GreB [Burkholderiales bacterium]|nr:transcription elongation factor GreB [Burkholderiales bacterium]
MSKAFTREQDGADEDEPAPEAEQPQGLKNYITPAGYARMQAELKQLLDVARPETVSVVHWAALNGDRSENGDYIYGKKRLREIDRRIRFLIKRLELAEVVASSGQEQDRVFFGATVSVRDGAGRVSRLSIVGMDEVDPTRGRVSWVSPIARALLKARAGESVTLRTPSGEEELQVLEVEYLELP